MSSRAVRSSTPAGALTSRNKGDVGPVLDEVAGRSVVKVGDLVILWTEDTSGWGDLSRMGGGPLVSDGFSDGSCWVKDDISVPNIVGSLFRVTIKQVYTANKKLSRHLDALSTADLGRDKGEEELGLKDRRLRQEAHAEQHSNFFQATRSIGNPVAYGSVIQLQHVKSGGYLTVCPKEVAEVETNCSKVAITDRASHDAWFCLQPRHRAVGAGEFVRYGDSICIESVKLAKQQLHCSRELTYDAGANGSDGCPGFEVNSHTERTTWKLRLFSDEASASAENKAEGVCGGQVVRIIHENSGGWLMAPIVLPNHSGSSAKATSAKASYGIKCETNAPQLGVRGLWRVEKLDTLDGSGVGWGCECPFRLRHLASGAFLSIGGEDGRTVGLSPPGAPVTPTTMLCIEQALSGDERKSGDICCFIKSAMMPGYLRMGGGMLRSSVELHAVVHPLDAVSLRIVDEAEVCEVYMVDTAKAALGTYLSTIRPPRSNIPVFPPPLQLSKLPHRYAANVLTSLETFCKMQQEGSGSTTVRRRRQELLKDMGLLEMMVEITAQLQMRTPQPKAETETKGFEENEKDEEKAKWDDTIPAHDAHAGDVEDSEACLKVFCCAHKALAVALQGQPESGFALRDSFELLQKQSSSSSMAGQLATCTIKMLLDKNTQLKEWLPRARLECFMADMDRVPSMRAHTVSMLTSVVACGSKGIRKNQDFVLRKWLQDKKRANLIIDTRCTEGGMVQVCIKDAEENGGRHRYVDVESFSATSLTRDSKDRPIYEFYSETLRLLAALCMGDNEKARALVGGAKRHVTYQSLRLCIANERIPATLRTNFADLMRACYLMRPNVDYISPLKTTYMFKEIRGTSDSPPSLFPAPLITAPSECEEFEDLKRDCVILLSSHSVASVPESEPGQNDLTYAITKNVSELVHLGFFQAVDEIMDSLVPALILVLDGKSDVVSANDGPLMIENDEDLPEHEVMKIDGTLQAFAKEQNIEKRFRHTEAAAPVFAAKRQILKLMLHLFDMRHTMRLEMLLSLCKDVSEVGRLQEGRSVSLLRTSSFRSSEISGDYVKEISRLLLNEYAGHLRGILGLLAIPGGGKDGKFNRIMFDLMQYQDSMLSTLALRCLIRESLPKLELFRAMNSIQILNIGSDCDAYIRIREEYYPIIRSNTPSVMAHLLRTDLSLGERPPLKFDLVLATIAECTDLCKRSGVQTQEMMCRIGIPLLVFDMFAKAHVRFFEPPPTRNVQKSALDEEDKWELSLLQACCDFISEFCTDGHSLGFAAGQSLALSLVPLLCQGLAGGLGWHGGKALRAIYQDNESHLLHVNLDVIDALVNGMASRGGVSCIETLCTIVGGGAVGTRDYALRKICEMGPLHLQAGAEEQALLLFRAPDGRAQRDALVHSDPHQLLPYHIALLRILRALLPPPPHAQPLASELFPMRSAAEDLASPTCPTEVKAELLAAVRDLHLGGMRSMTTDLAELEDNLWNMLDDLSSKLSAMSPVELSRDLTARDHSRTLLTGSIPRDNNSQNQGELAKLLVDYWVPLLQRALEDRSLVATQPRRYAAAALVRQIIEVANAEPIPRASVCKAFLDLWSSWEALGFEEFAGPGPSCNVRDAAVHGQFIHGSPKADSLPALSTKMGREACSELHAKFDVFSRAFVEAVDPLVVVAGNSESDSAGMQLRQELMEFSMVFHNEKTLGISRESKVDIGATGLSVPGGSAAKPGSSDGRGQFTADNAICLVDVLHKMITAKAKSKVRPGDSMWEVDMIIGIQTLIVLTNEWMSSVTELHPPEWLVNGIPRLLVKLISMGNLCGDQVAMCSLELGISALHGGNNDVQMSFYSILRDEGRGGAAFMTQLRERLIRGTKEAEVLNEIVDSVMQVGSKLGDLREYSDMDRTIHTLMLNSMRGGGSKWGAHTALVLRFLHLLCEGHNLVLQNYLRYQGGKRRSTDLVSAVANFATSMSGFLNPFTVTLTETAWLALAEFVQSPCRPNQRLLVDTNIPSQANHLLCMSERRMVANVRENRFSSSFSETQAYGKNINNLKAGVVTCLLSILECVNTPYIPQRLLDSLDSSALVDNMNLLALVYNASAVENKALALTAGDGHKFKSINLSSLSLRSGNQSQLKRRSSYSRADVLESAKSHSKKEGNLEVPEDIEESENMAELYYIMYITLAGFDEKGELKDGMKNIWDLENLKKKVGAIEISRNGMLEKANFIIPSMCMFLTDKTKQELLFSIDRANLQTQLTDFTERFDTLYEEMKHQKKLNESIFLNFYRETFEWREKFFFLNALLINLLLLLFYGYKCQGQFLCGEQESLIVYALKPGWRELVTVLASIQVLFAVSRQWWYVVERGIPSINRQVILDAKDPPKNIFIAWLVKLPPEQSDPSYRHIQKANGQTLRDLSHWTQKINFVRCYYLCTDRTFLGISFMTAINVLALVITAEGGKLLLVFHLLEVFNHSRVLQNVMRSITYRGGTLLQTAGLALVWIYFFGVFGFLLFPELFQFNESDVMGGRKLEPNNNGARCTSIWKCSLVVLDMGFRKGDVGEGLDDIPWKLEDSTSPDQFRILYRMIYTLLFFILVTTILMNIIFGVIIDTFAELRAKKDAVDRDISGRCFVCGIDRFVLDTMGDAGSSGFQDHIANDHNMWKYLYFQVYLRQKDFSEYSGSESYVFSKTLDLEKHPDTHEILVDCDTGKELKFAKAQIDILWIPQQDAMVLKRKRPTTDQLDVQRLQGLHTSTKSLTARLNDQFEKVLAAASQPSILRAPSA